MQLGRILITHSFTCNAENYIIRGGTFDKALNDFMQVLRLDPENTEAQQYSLLVKEIFAYHYVDQFNP